MTCSLACAKPLMCTSIHTELTTNTIMQNNVPSQEAHGTQGTCAGPGSSPCCLQAQVCRLVRLHAMAPCCHCMPACKHTTHMPALQSDTLFL